ncbi:hypothetical protein P3X46_024533 [Hevea brasiliensis]|uniref:Aspartic peptidase DDI1-type domain-containing protein n=1 Tax=Hevea brasiliensis TaxID=3981 RepID=A0ABQ9L2S2_HEVBR|nr:hypothetical protein P3X46_024533 [Hevea brasiliensis]
MKHEDEAYELLEKIAKNTHLWSSPRGPAPTQKRQAAGMYDLDPFNMINAKFDALTNVLAKKMEDLSMLSENSEKRENEKETYESEKQESEKESAEKCKEKIEEKEEKYIPPEPQLPFPQRFQKAKLDKQFGKFLERKLEDHETVALTEECSAILQRKLPPKLKDPGSFSIPCHIGESCSTKALCDLGASVSLMPLSIYEKLNMGDLKPTHISLQLADRSIKYPEGILENVPLKVGKFYIPVDFVILDMEEDSNIPIILGRPFTAL